MGARLSLAVPCTTGLASRFIFSPAISSDHGPLCSHAHAPCNVSLYLGQAGETHQRTRVSLVLAKRQRIYRRPVEIEARVSVVEQLRGATVHWPIERRVTCSNTCTIRNAERNLWQLGVCWMVSTVRTILMTVVGFRKSLCSLFLRSSGSFPMSEIPRSVHRFAVEFFTNDRMALESTRTSERYLQTSRLTARKHVPSSERKTQAPFSLLCW